MNVVCPHLAEAREDLGKRRHDVVLQMAEKDIRVVSCREWIQMISFCKLAEQLTEMIEQGSFSTFMSIERAHRIGNGPTLQKKNKYALK